MNLPVSKSDSYRIFNSIAQRYDFVNSVLSFGLHHLWRLRLRQSLPKGEGLAILDLATGTGDVALELAKSPRVVKVTGLDLSEGMLAVGRQKVQAAGRQDQITMIHGDAMKLPFPDQSFHAVTMSFGIRNVPNAVVCMREAWRVLKPGGRLLVLEFGLPSFKPFRALHLWYLRTILPRLGNMLTGHDFAYSYLNKTIEDFPYGEAFVARMKAAGFTRASHTALTMGIVQLYRGDKLP